MRWCSIRRIVVVVALLLRSELCGAIRQQRCSRRVALALPMAAPLLGAAPSLGIVGSGAKSTLAEAQASGAVALWIDLEGCEICRHDVPAVCTGTLVADDLVLSAQHCVDIPESLDGALTKVVFGTDIFDARATSVPVARYVRPKDVPGLKLSSEPLGNDLVLIKLAKPAPKKWTRVALGDGGTVPAYSRAAKLYSFGDSVDDENAYSSGVLQGIDLVPITPMTDGKPDFYARPLKFDSPTGTCNGDSGGALLLDDGPGRRPSVLGVVSSTSLPCAGSTTKLTNPTFPALADFLRLGSRMLGTPLDVPTGVTAGSGLRPSSPYAA